MSTHYCKCYRGLTLKALALVLSFVALTGPGEAATRIWSGTTSGLWSNPANWTDGILPIVGDSLEFPDEAKIHDVYNDLDTDFDLGAITITGRNYVLRGNRIVLQGDLISTPNNSTNRILLSVLIGAPLKIRNLGYYNELELAGELKLFYHSLVLDTASSILITGGIVNTNEAVSVIQKNSGTVNFGPNGFIQGTVIVEWGKLILGNLSPNPHVIREYDSSLIVGDDANPPGYARVIWESANKLSRDIRVIVNRSGRLELNGFSQTVSSLSGTGVVDLQSGELTLKNPTLPAIFGGDLRGHGMLHIRGVDVGQELGGHNTLTGVVDVASILVTNLFNHEVSEIPGKLILSGSLSNAAVLLSTNAILQGNGIAKNLTVANAIVNPGPGTLRILNTFLMDAPSQLRIQLDGPEESMIRAGTIDLGGSSLHISQERAGMAGEFTLISANNAIAGSTFEGLPEGAWLLAGETQNPDEFQITYLGNGGHDVVLARTGTFVPPTLRIRQLSTTERIIEWPLAAQGYSLQYSDSLATLNWMSNGLSQPVTNTTDHFVIDATSEGRRFYRLIR